MYHNFRWLVQHYYDVEIDGKKIRHLKTHAGFDNHDHAEMFISSVFSEIDCHIYDTKYANIKAHYSNGGLAK